MINIKQFYQNKLQEIDFLILFNIFRYFICKIAIKKSNLDQESLAHEWVINSFRLKHQLNQIDFLKRLIELKHKIQHLPE